MAKKLKVMTVVGTRPEIIKMSSIIKACDRHFEHILVHTGQNYDYTLNQVFFEELKLREPDYYLDVAGENLGVTMGNVLSKSYELMAKERPDALIVLGDTNSCLCVISAKRHKIPIFHMEAGNRCFDENLPEEVNRRIVDVTSDVNLCYSEHARRNLKAAGVRPEYTFVVGSPMAEVFEGVKDGIEASDVLARLGIEKNGYILLSAHREENIDNEKNLDELVDAINRLAEHYQMPVIYSVHPRSRKMIEARGITFNPLVRQMTPFGFLDYNCLQKNAYCVVSDSGTLAEESAYFRFPAVSVRTSTERQEAVDRGAFVIGGIRAESVINSVDMATSFVKEGVEASDVPDYTDDNVSMKVVKIIQGYTDIINRRIWGKY